MSECNSVELNSIECISAECNSIEETYYQRNKNVILKRVKDYYENGEKRLRDQARGKYTN